MYTRREFGTLTLGAFAAMGLRSSAEFDPIVNGVRLGAQTYSFRDLPRTPGGDAIDPVIKACVQCGIGEVELYAPQAEPRANGAANTTSPPAGSPEALKARDDLRKWRLETSLDHFKDIRRKFEAAGITIYAYNYTPNASYTDEENDRGFEMTRALGAEIITASTTLAVAKRIAPLAAKHKMVVAMHGHSNVTDPNQFATPESFAAALKMSKYFKVNLDIGHFTAANFDALAFIREHHADITNLHLKDSKRNQSEFVPWGEGDAPIGETLQLLRREKWPIRAYVEYEYKGSGTPVEEVRKCMAFAKRALGA
jgi:sugar phosphate isomerase/epimerase